MVSSAEKITDRRQATNAFFVTLFTLYLGISGALASRMGTEALVYLSGDPLAQFGALGTALFGVGLAEVWKSQIKSFKLLNSAKFEVILKMEKSLPVQIFGDEWNSLTDKNRYTELTAVEVRLPKLFQGALILCSIVIATYIHGRDGFGVSSIFCLLVWAIPRHGRRAIQGIEGFFKSCFVIACEFFWHIWTFRPGKSAENSIEDLDNNTPAPESHEI